MSQKVLRLKIGRIVRICRCNQQMTQGELAERIEITRKHVIDIEKSHQEPTIGVLLRILESLGCTIQIQQGANVFYPAST